MFGRQERLAIILLLTVAVIIIASHLTLGYIGKQPFASQYTEQSREGDLVLMTGTIDALLPTRTGGHLIITINNISVFLPNTIASDIDLHAGKNISLIGTVQVYQGKREVVVTSSSDISVEP